MTNLNQVMFVKTILNYGTDKFWIQLKCWMVSLSLTLAKQLNSLMKHLRINSLLQFQVRPIEFNFWREAINPDQCMSAYFDNELVGIALFATKSASGFKSESGKILQRQLGIFRALRAGFVFALFTHRPQKGEMYIEAISVSSKVRGQGVGKMLLDKLVEKAKEDSQSYLSLKVILENERALKLYEREGFKIAKTQRSRFLKLIVGIQGAHEMEKLIN